MRHTITLDGKTYHSGVDIQAEELQHLLMKTASFPITSQPSSGEFAALYKHLAATDPDILSIHMSSGLSGTFNAAHAGAQMTPEANVTLVDTKTLCAVLGWQVAAAARALKAGWPLDKILALIDRIGAASESIYTLSDLKYLINGGRISHMKGLVASLLKIKPLIGVEKVGGTYVQLGMARTLDQALRGLVEIMLKQHARRQRSARAGAACAQPGRRRSTAQPDRSAVQVHMATRQLHVAGAGRAHRPDDGGCGLRAAGRLR